MRTCTEGDKVTVYKTCLYCHKESRVTVDRDRFNEWQSGALIQRIFADMPADEREILISGTHPACWEAMWKEPW